MLIDFNRVRLIGSGASAPIKKKKTIRHWGTSCQRSKYPSFLPALLPFTRLLEAQDYLGNGVCCWYDASEHFLLNMPHCDPESTNELLIGLLHGLRIITMCDCFFDSSCFLIFHILTEVMILIKNSDDLDESTNTSKAGVPLA